MTYPASVDSGDHEWQPCSIIVPRFVKFVTRHGMRTRLILPGRYMVRQSRSLGRRLYRNFRE